VDDKSSITSLSIVTATAAPSMAKYHNRMPLVLEESQFEDWMCASRDGGKDDAAL